MAFLSAPHQQHQQPTPGHVIGFLQVRGWWFAGTFPHVGDLWSRSDGPPAMFPWYEAVAYEMASMFSTLEK